MGAGDEILAVGMAERLYASDPSKRVAICDQAGRPRWHPIWEGNPIIARPEDVAKGWADLHTVINAPNARPYIVYPFSEETGWTFNKAFRCRDHVAKIYLTDQEKARGAQALAFHGPYVLIEPYTKHANFQWPMERWAELVEACPDLTFVQHTHKDSERVPGAKYEQATFREACGLIASAEVYVRSESGLCHAAAALGIPQVTLFGGCMDPEVMGYYPNQVVIRDEREGSPCGSWKPCEHCKAAMARISVEQVIEALRGSLPAREAVAVSAVEDKPRKRTRQRPAHSEVPF